MPLAPYVLTRDIIAAHLVNNNTAVVIRVLQLSYSVRPLGYPETGALVLDLSRKLGPYLGYLKGEVASEVINISDLNCWSYGLGDLSVGELTKREIAD